MTFDPTKPVQTRDGRPARILCTDMKNEERPICAAVADSDGVETPEVYTGDGQFCNSNCHTSRFDLINIPEKRVAYINFYGSGYAGYAYDTRAKADQLSKTCRIACVRVEYEDGQFDD